MFRYVLDLFFCQFSVHGQGEHFVGKRFRHGEVAFAVAEMLVGLLQVERFGVVYGVRDIKGGQLLGKCIAVTVKYPECVLVINMGRVWCGCGSLEIPDMAQAGVVLCGGGAAGGNVLIQMVEFHL